jgi:hypothetical protein
MTTQNWSSKTVPSSAGAPVATATRRTGNSTPKAAPAPTHEQISARAKAIWEAKGCPAGRDEENWRQAEAELKAAISRK